MEKYEFNVKVDILKKSVKSGDYETALRIADSVDWRRVHNASLLSIVSEVYEKNKEYTEAKEILLLAYERAAKGKRLLYKLTTLALKEGNVAEAENFYKEFYELSPEDSRNYILRYLILKEKGAPRDQLINTLEMYTDAELDEKWLYELAELYHEDGRSEECVKACDNIMLMFGLGKYVDKAIELKTKREGKPLTDYQQGLLDNREHYEERLKEAEEEVSSSTNDDYRAEEVDDDAEQYIDSDEDNQDTEPDAEDRENTPLIQGHVEAQSRFDSSSYLESVQESEPSEPERIEETQKMDHQEEDFEAKEKEMQEQLSHEIHNIANAAVDVKESEEDKTKVLADLKEILARHVEDPTKEEHPTKVETQEVYEGEEDFTPEIEDLDEEEETIYPCVLITAKDATIGLEEAKEKLKEIYTKTKSPKRAAKISVEKLNKLGKDGIEEKVGDKDLIIEGASGMRKDIADLLYQLVIDEGKILILVDRPEHREKMIQRFPKLAQLSGVVPYEEEKEIEDDFEEIDFSPEQEQPKPVEKVSAEEESEDDVEDEAEEEEVIEEEPKPTEQTKKGRRERKETKALDAEKKDPDYASKELTLEEFVAFAREYCKHTDCNLTRTGEEGVRHHAEIMEEEGRTLTKLAAQKLIEEAADRAENPSIFMRIVGVFSQRYDKNGMLILKEEHFLP